MVAETLANPLDPLRPDRRTLLRLATAGSVDDGKSTLIGRLLFDSKQTFIDQMEAIERTSRTRGEDDVNLAYLTDGLRSEREQGITIDVRIATFLRRGGSSSWPTRRVMCSTRATW